MYDKSYRYRCVGNTCSSIISVIKSTAVVHVVTPAKYRHVVILVSLLPCAISTMRCSTAATMLCERAVVSGGLGTVGEDA